MCVTSQLMLPVLACIYLHASTSASEEDLHREKIEDMLFGEGDMEEMEKQRYGYFPGLHQDIDGIDVFADILDGTLRGKRRPAIKEAGGTADAVDWYLGIPFVKPPVGDLRFKPPVHGQRWFGVRNATRLPPVCPQYAGFEVYARVSLQDEDCLYLNVFAPYEAAAPKKKYPVMVYIHGGSYRVGSGNAYFGHVLAQHGIVVVCINYRLEALGFLTTGDASMPGNYGLLDQIAALKWVQRSIAAVGGDPSRVTISGNSAGGASVGLLTVSPAARGLFNQAIIQSGSPLSFWAMHNETAGLKSFFRHYAEDHGCYHDNTQSLISCLRDLPWKNFNFELRYRLPRISPSRTDIRPRVDNSIIQGMAESLYKEGHINVKSIMTGIVRDEWSRHIMFFLHEELLPSNPHLDDQMNDGMNRETFKEAINHVITNRFWWEDMLTPVVVHEYTNWSKVENPDENRHQYIQCITDMAMLAPTVQLAKLCAERNLPVYFYHFNHQSEIDDTYHPWQANFHQIELNYVFGSPFTGIDTDQGLQMNFSEEDKKVSRFMMQRWSNYIKHGTPNSPDTKAKDRWTQFKPKTSDYFHIDTENSHMKTFLRTEKVTFWNELMPSLRGHLAAKPSNMWKDRGASFWVLLVVCVVLLFLLLVSLVFITRMRTMYRRLSMDRVPTRV